VKDNCRLLICAVPALMLCACLVGAARGISAPICGSLAIVALALGAWIDWRSMRLPDWLTLPLLASGLAQALVPLWVSWPDSAMGAGLGYGLGWGVARLYRLRAGRDGLGGGDVKLLAALGAWLGWAMLPWVVVGAAAMALLTVVLLVQGGRLRYDQPVPFGPFLALGGGVGLVLTVAMRG
jgi:leader peptidase (prepilin peptidase) / N-methyltransferase